MKIIHYINLIATGAILFLYLLFFYGMMAQIALGPIQLILALILSFKYYKKLGQRQQILILCYWFAAIIALLIAAVTWLGHANESRAIIGLFVVPMLVACYFLYVTTQLDNYLSKKS